MGNKEDYLFMDDINYPSPTQRIPVVGVDYFTDADKQEFLEAIFEIMPEINPQNYVTKEHFHRVVRKLQKQINELKNELK